MKNLGVQEMVESTISAMENSIVETLYDGGSEQ
jgi:hypothetical protein